MYRAPIDDLRFTLEYVLEAGQLAQWPLYKEFSIELAAAVLAEADRFATGVLDPLNQEGDRVGATWTPEGVSAAPGFAEAYRQYVAGGWPQLGIDAELGGQGAPFALVSAVEEIWYGANMALMLCPMLSRGAIEALQLVGSPELKKAYLPDMIAGNWSGTMVLTESQAGSDLGAIRTRAQPAGDHYLLSGQKIFISYGDHDMTENIVHLVLARIEGAPPGVKGLSLFLVPKFVLGADGRPGRRERRALRVDRAQARHSRQSHLRAGLRRRQRGPGVPGGRSQPRPRVHVHHDERRATCRWAFRASGLPSAPCSRRAAGRVAGYRDGRSAHRARALLPITRHPDVRRLLLTMRSGVEAMRTLALYGALQLDLARAATDAKRARCGADARRAADSHRQGLGHGVRHRAGLPGSPGAWRHGVHRGDRDRADAARCAHNHHLRGHHRDPGERSAGAQARTRRRRGHAGTAGRRRAGTEGAAGRGRQPGTGQRAHRRARGLERTSRRDRIAPGRAWQLRRPRRMPSAFPTCGFAASRSADG